jgi:methionine-rich copper-binding protein CopC
MFQGSAQRNRLLAGLALLLMLVTGGWVYQSLAPVGPEVPFSELPVAIQLEFGESLDQGYAHLEISDIDGALRYFDAAWLLHPWNPDAVRALDSMVERVTVLFADARSPEMATLLLPSLEAMQSNAYLAQQSDLKQLVNAVTEVQFVR